MEILQFHWLTITRKAANEAQTIFIRFASHDCRSCLWLCDFSDLAGAKHMSKAFICRRLLYLSGYIVAALGH